MCEFCLGNKLEVKLKVSKAPFAIFVTSKNQAFSTLNCFFELGLLKDFEQV